MKTISFVEITGCATRMPKDAVDGNRRGGIKFKSLLIKGPMRTNLFFNGSLLFFVILLMITSGCDQMMDQFPGGSHGADSKYRQTNLVADTAGFNAARMDSNLNNAWGIAINPNGVLWISSNGKGMSVVYDKNGVPKRKPVGISSQGMPNGGAPSGVVFNNTGDFKIMATGETSKFIFAGEDGKLYAWASGDTTRTVADRSSSGAVYKGIELAKDGGANFLYVTNFSGSKIDVFDNNFNYVTSKPFSDPGIPPDFGPFNIRMIDGLLYVTYAKHLAPENKDDQKGVGNGYVDIFKMDGTFVKRFASQGKLNSPWGIEKAPQGFGQGKSSILVGNFGDGRINVFEAFEGEFMGQIKSASTGMPLTIDGLWGITFPDGNISGDNPNKLYFTAGPNDEGHGLFGYIMKQ